MADKKLKECGGLPSIVIVGRPNVGKSALFNAILDRRVSIVHEECGVTRDRIVAVGKWRGRAFQLVDTGGLVAAAAEEQERSGLFGGSIHKQAMAALESAVVVLFVVDVTAGVTTLDEEVARLIRKSGATTLLVANKSDNTRLADSANEFRRLGFSEPFTVSSLHKIGVEHLLAAAARHLPKSDDPATPTDRVRLAIVGRPNVGKSSLVNGLFGSDRMIVSDISGTTRDAVDVDCELRVGDRQVPATLIDTAGLRRRGRADSAIEIFSIIRAHEAIRRCDVALLVIEASPDGATAQDAKIARLISDAGKACVLVANKFDLCKEQGVDRKAADQAVRDSLRFLAYAPLILTSATTGSGLEEAAARAIEVADQLRVRIPTAMLNTAISEAIARRSPPAVKTSFFKVFYVTMTASAPPTFVLFVNNPELCPKPYQGYLVNSLRRVFGLVGLPIKLEMRRRARKKLS